jgi:hypothetical protein
MTHTLNGKPLSPEAGERGAWRTNSQTASVTF